MRQAAVLQVHWFILASEEHLPRSRKVDLLSANLACVLALSSRRGTIPGA